MWIDVAAAYWLLIKLLLYFSSLVILVSSADDAFMDVYYWVRRLYRALTLRRRHPYMNEDKLLEPEEQPIAIMIPAWQEAGVIEPMAKLAASTYVYENYHIFVGTYPNDLDTQADVDRVSQTYPNVHKVVTRDPGPTTKADCLNNIIEFIFNFEKEHDLTFPCIAYHDAEDVVHPLELKLFNYLVPRKHLVQIPVFPLVRRLRDFTSGHYQDEFAEYHSKDVVVREALTGNVPSAGVGTAFSRKAIMTLSELNGGRVFNTESLTEDYEIGARLKEQGLLGVFVRFYTHRVWGKPKFLEKDRQLICVREYFPNVFSHAVRQKSRWIVGIVFQGWRSLGWFKGAGMRYMLFRDRKALITHPVNCIAYFVVLNIAVMEILTGLGDDAYWFPSLIPYESWLWDVLYINGFFLLNRIVQRAYFCTKIYGLAQGIMSIPRIIWGNVINFMAFFRALFQVRQAKKKGKAVKWDKTTHEFPEDHFQPEEK